MIFFLACYIIINLTGFIIMGVDKKRAIRGAWRISEASLFCTAFLGGALGCTIGMHFFHHKTRHWYFRLGLPAIFVLQLLLLLFFFFLLETSGPVEDLSEIYLTPESEDSYARSSM